MFLECPFIYIGRRFTSKTSNYENVNDILLMMNAMRRLGFVRLERESATTPADNKLASDT